MVLCFDKKKCSRPGGSETTAVNAVMTESHHKTQKHYTTKVMKMQVFFFGLSVGLLLSASVLLLSDVFKKPEFVPIEHRVREGEVLESIAMMYKPEDVNKGYYMDWVYAHNASADIYPGDVVIMGEVKSNE